MEEVLWKACDALRDSIEPSEYKHVVLSLIFFKYDIPLVGATHGFKFEAPDGKQHKADVLNSEGVILLAKHYPNKFVSQIYG